MQYSVFEYVEHTVIPKERLDWVEYVFSLQYAGVCTVVNLSGKPWLENVNIVQVTTREMGDCYTVCVWYQRPIGKERPPLGLRPRYIVDAARIKEISEAIQRYTEANKKIPSEWVEEYNELVVKEKQ